MREPYKSKHVNEEKSAPGSMADADIAADRAGAAGTHEKDGFVVTPLSEDARKRAGICKYYRPYRIDTVHNGATGGYRLVKRIMDVIIAIAALTVLSPVLLGFMLAVVVEDPSAGPVFRQKRIGLNGTPFTMYKLRSMYKDAEDTLLSLSRDNQAQEKAFKMKNDPRVTRVGKVARSICVDELFQMINVVRGDMSIVGPRPPLPDEVLKYDDYERQRLSVMPGLTCIWQVYPGRHEISFDDWVAMDLKYQNECSMMLDLKLILYTVLTIVKGNGD